MRPNVGKIDRTLRALVGVALIASWPAGLLQGTIAIVALVIGLVLLATAIVGWCPPYALFGIDTGARDREA